MVKIKMVKIYTIFQTKMTPNPYPLEPDITIFFNSLYKGVLPISWANNQASRCCKVREQNDEKMWLDSTTD